MIRHHLCVALAATGFVVALAGTSEAAVITFDQVISGVVTDDPEFDLDNCVVFCGYAGTAGNAGVMTTQGFTFTALTNPGAGDEGVGVVVNAGALPGLPNNGNYWMLTQGIVQMTMSDDSAFSLLSFQAASVDQSDSTVGQFMRVFADKASGNFESLTFSLAGAPGFQTFTLPSTWTDLTKVRFSGRFDADPANRTPVVAGVDNINAAAVPEPTSLLLITTGVLPLLAMARRRRGVLISI
jgi:hypothetical protein